MNNYLKFNENFTVKKKGDGEKLKIIREILIKLIWQTICQYMDLYFSLNILYQMCYTLNILQPI